MRVQTNLLVCFDLKTGVITKRGVWETDYLYFLFFPVPLGFDLCFYPFFFLVWVTAVHVGRSTEQFKPRLLFVCNFVRSQRPVV